MLHRMSGYSVVTLIAQCHRQTVNVLFDLLLQAKSIVALYKVYDHGVVYLGATKQTSQYVSRACRGVTEYKCY